MSKLKVIVIDDESSARNEVKRALLKYPAFEVVAEARHAEEARQLIRQWQPDLIFLDIQMPEESGFDLLASLDSLPEVIFTTAFDQYALQAFEVNALDYLMKPVREERFDKAVQRVLALDLDKKRKSLPAEKTIFIKDGAHCHFIKLNEIFLITSMDNYARLHFGNKEVLIKSSLNQLEQKLDPGQFFRINRRQIINLNYIERVYPAYRNSLSIRLKSGILLDISDRQSVRFKQVYGI